MPREFFLPSAQVVAPALLGHWLMRNTADGPCGGPIVETEAYLWDDPACHAVMGPTPRNEVMFGAPGHGYVYLIYGLHFCANAVCRPSGHGEAVLIRAIEATMGEEFMRRQRNARSLTELTNGPAKLCEAMHIDRSLNGCDLCDLHSPVFIAANPRAAAFRRRRGPLVTTTRIGLTQAAALPLRFLLARSEFVSRKPKPPAPS